MQPRQQTVKIRIEIGPGLPRDFAPFISRMHFARYFAHLWMR